MGILDPTWMAAGLCSLQEAHMFVNIWLKRYFDKFGDCIPNRMETALIIIAKKDIYYQYSNEMYRVLQKPVDYGTFNSIWNVQYPRHVNRPWCNIPGKSNLAVPTILKVFLNIFPCREM